MGPTEVGTGGVSPEAPAPRVTAEGVAPRAREDFIEHPPGVRERTGVVQTLPMVMPVPAVSAPATEDDLIAGLRRGDRSAVSRAYEAHHAAIRAFHWPSGSRRAVIRISPGWPPTASGSTFSVAG